MSESAEILLETRLFRIVRREHQFPDGSRHTREYLEHPGAVTVLPMLDMDRVCLIRNQRPAVGEQLIELPAGTLEPNEPPETTAHRELAEETGYRAGRMEKLCEFFMSPGILSEKMHLYLASELAQGETALEPGEVIEPLVVSWDEAMRMVADGRVRDAKSLVGLLYFDRIRRAPPQPS